MRSAEAETGAVPGIVADHIEAKTIIVSSGDAFLWQTAKTAGWDVNASPSMRLKAESAVIPFAGREDELTDFATWLASDRDLAMRVYHAGGGMGKTRLLMQATAQSKKAGWRAGFLEASETAPVTAFINAVTSPQPLLLVIDYAETRPDHVRDLINHYRTCGATQKTRLVLLVRGLGAWWDGLTGNRADAASAFFETPDCETIKLDPLRNDAAARVAEFTRSRDRFHALLTADATARGQAPAAAATGTPDLARDEFGRVLSIHIAAYIAALGSQVGGAEDALQKMLGHEQSFWLNRWQGENSDRLRRRIGVAAALSTLAGQATIAENISAQAQAPLLRDKPEEDRDEIARFLADIYPGEAGGIAGLQPDLIGEALVERVLTDHGEGLLQAAFHTDRPVPVLAHGFVVLMRLWSRKKGLEDWVQVLETTMGPHLGNRALAQDWSFALPEGRSLSFDPFALTILAAALGGTLEDGTVDVENLPVLGHLANRLANLGQREQALEAAIIVCDGYRHLAAALPDAFTPALAMSLNNLANMLSALGRREPALAAAQEAVDLHRAQAATRPDAFTPKLAGSLNNLATMLSDLGQREPALAAAQEAVDLYRALAEARPDAFTPDLAMSLNNLANMLSDLGRREPALAAAQEAVQALAPYFLSCPEAHLQWMEVMARVYVRACEAADREPDPALLQPIAKIFERLQQQG